MFYLIPILLLGGDWQPLTIVEESNDVKNLVLEYRELESEVGPEYPKMKQLRRKIMSAYNYNRNRSQYISNVILEIQKYQEHELDRLLERYKGAILSDDTRQIEVLKHQIKTLHIQ